MNDKKKRAELVDFGFGLVCHGCCEDMDLGEEMEGRKKGGYFSG